MLAGSAKHWRGLVAVAGVACLLGTASAHDLALDEHVQYIVTLEEAKGHFLASRASYRLDQHVRAGVHASHPIQELGYRLYRPVTAVDPALGKRVETGLKEPGRAVEARVPASEYDAVVTRALALLDEAGQRAVPAETLKRPAFQARVIRGLLDLVVEEYDESVAKGKVVVEIEYQDAWGFLQRARTLYEAVKARLRFGDARAAKAIDEQFRTLTTAIPSVTPPKAAMSAERVRAAADAIANAVEQAAQ
jgi:hypothetical protein